MMSGKSKRKPKDFSMHKAVSVAMTIFVWAWMECFHLPKLRSADHRERV